MLENPSKLKVYEGIRSGEIPKVTNKKRQKKISRPVKILSAGT